MKRVEANDPNLIYELANHHHTKGLQGSREDREKAKELNYGLRPQNLGPVGRIFNWVSVIRVI
jgi:hypothetical protein